MKEKNNKSMKEKIEKLYKVTLRGMTYSTSSPVYGISYVIAYDAEEAYRKVKNSLDKDDIGYSKDRALDKIELLAENYKYTDTNTILYI